MLIFAARTVFLTFPLDFGSILSEKSMFFRTRFPHAARAFFEMATLTIVWFLQYESHFFIFCLRAFFFRKKGEKMIHHRVRKKTSKNEPPGTCFGTQNPLKSTSEWPEIAQIAPKIEKMACKNSCVFWHAKKTRKNGKKK